MQNSAIKSPFELKDFHEWHHEVNEKIRWFEDGANRLSFLFRIGDAYTTIYILKRKNKRRRFFFLQEKNLDLISILEDYVEIKRKEYEQYITIGNDIKK